MADRPGSGDGNREEPRERQVDRDAIAGVLERHPVRLAVLFGSRATGAADPRSDVDIVVELSEELDAARTDALMELLVDLSVALDRNDVDLSFVGDLKPRVGLAAFEHGELLLGSPERADEHRRQFARQVDEASEASLRDRLDRSIEHVDRLLEGTR